MSGGSPAGGASIVGIGCRFPGGADSPEAFWRLLRDGVDAVGPLPPGRFDPDSVPIASAEGGFLDDVDRFDAAFFGMSPREARRMDPQHRLLLEVVHEALEDAGVAPATLRGRNVGVWVGLWVSDYEQVLLRNPSALDFHGLTGTGRYSASGRISFAYDFRGPAVTVDTGCSAALVALDSATRAVEDGTVDFAVVAAANLVLQPFVNIAYTKSGMLSPGGRCRFAGQDPDGYVRSEGAAAILLSPGHGATDARRTPRARVRAVAVNADGFANGQLATPSRESQETLIRSAWQRSGLDPAIVPYVEAHGTGTRAGDPVEVGALGAVLGADRPPDRPLLVGSVKSNIGHTEACAGLAGIIKTVLALEHGEIPPSLHSTPSNPDIDFDGLGVQVPEALRSWPEGAPRWAGVSSFGITGTNAHVVLEGVQTSPRTSDGGAEPPLEVWSFAVSGATEGARADAAARMLDYLDARPDAPLADLSWTTTAARDHYRERAVVLADDRATLVEALTALRDAAPHPNLVSGTATESAPRVGFVFSGQGSQWAGMGRSPGSAAAVFDRTLEALGGGPVGEVLRGELSLEGVARIQPALGAVQIAMARQLMAWGLHPDAVTGHSMGEVAAAATAGVVSDDRALEILEVRSALLSEIAGRGAMALIDEPAPEVETRLDGWGDRISIAGVNGPRTTVVAGEPEAVEALVTDLDAAGVFARRVRVDVASHSAQTDPLLPRLRERLAALQAEGERLPLYSTVTGERLEGARMGADYWADNLRRPVQLDASIRRMLGDGIDLFVEVAPHPVLSASIADIARDTGARPAIVCTGKRDEPSGPVLMRLLAEVHCRGAAIDWPRLGADGARVTALPTYPWQRERHWIEGWGDGGAPSAIGAAEPEGTALPEHTAWAVEWTALDPDPGGEDPLADRWWVGPDGSGEARAFASLVEAAGGTVVPGLDPSCAGVAYFAADDPAPESALLDRAVGRTLETLGAVRRMAESGAAPRHGSWWVTTGVQAPPGRSADAHRAGDAVVWGVLAAVREELPNLAPRLLDVAGGAEMAAGLAAAVRAGHPDRRLALDGGQLFGARLEPAAPPERRRSLDPGGCWLVTGGLGALGRVAAEELARRGVGHLILVGRTPLPPRRRWAALAPDHRSFERVCAVRALEAAGAAVHLWTIDLADRGALDDALDQWEAEGRPPLTGVVHCAGQLHGGLAADLGEADVRAVLGAKVGGAEVIRRRYPEVRTIHASSLSSLFPRAGQAHYAAANAVLDALARAGGDQLSVSWGVWADTGMVAGEAGARAVREMADDGLAALAMEEGRSLFRRFVDAAQPHLVLAPIDRGRLARRHEGDPFIAGHGPPTGPTDDAPVRLDADGVLGLVRQQAARVLELSPDSLLVDRPLGSQGLDSVMAMELRNALERELGLRLPASVVWNHPTVAALAGHLAERVTAAAPADSRSPDEGGRSAEGAPQADDRHTPADGSRDLAARVATLARATDDDVLQALRGGGR